MARRFVLLIWLKSLEVANRVLHQLDIGVDQRDCLLRCAFMVLFNELSQEMLQVINKFIFYCLNLLTG